MSEFVEPYIFALLAAGLCGPADGQCQSTREPRIGSLGYSRETNSRCLPDIAQGDKHRRDARATERRNRSRGLGARETKAAPAQDIPNR
jgi:hypothetical protein